MNLNALNKAIRITIWLRKTLFVMKLTTLIFILTLMQVSAASFAQKVNLVMQKAKLERIFSEITRQTGYDVFYSDVVFDNSAKVDVNFKNAPLTEVLETILRKQKALYTIKDKTIIIYRPSNQKTTTASIGPTLPKQTITISGVVRNEKGVPIPNVTVNEKSTANSTSTNNNGAFSINVKDNSSLLVFSMIGFISLERKVEIPNMDVILKEDISVLDQVVVVGYGTQKKSNLTGAVGVVTAKQFENKPVVSLAEGLAGEVTGLTVTQSSGKPGTINTNLRVRGVGTWGNSSPLVLVDGIAMNIFDVMPGDVESVTVLKDAASAAIYGSRAANGVILVTTKRGSKDKLSLSYNGQIGRQYATRVPVPASSWQFAEMINKVTENLTGVPGTTFSQEKIERMRNGGDPDVLEGSTNWYKELIKPASMQSHSISATGGNDKTTFAGSVGYTKQNGVINSTYDRYNMRINTQTKFSPWFTLDMNASYINDDRKESSVGAETAYNAVTRSSPFYPVKYSNGAWSFLSAPHNAARRASFDYGITSVRGDKLAILVSPEVKPIKGLTLKGTFGYETKYFLTKTSTRILKYEAFAPAGQAENTVVARNGQSDYQTQDRYLTAFLTATYDKSIGNHNFKILAGASAEKSNFNDIYAARQDFPKNDFSEINLGDVNTSNAGGSSLYRSLQSLFGRLNYDYKNKYLFEANFRIDGSSKFLEGHQWGKFPAFSAGWRVSEEDFFKSAKKIIQDLKIRGSWGKLGNNQINDFLFQSTYGGGDPYIFNGTSQSSYTELTLGNRIITWEKATHTNIGIDLSTLNNRLNMNFEWYNRTTNDILLNLAASQLLGIAAPTQNAGSVQNRGWELGLEWKDQIGSDFRYNIKANLSDVKNKVLDLKGFKTPTSNLTTRIEGQPLDALFGWETLGIATSPELYNQYKEVMHTFNPLWSLGDIIVKDRNGDGRISAEDKTVIGNIIPRYTFGLTLSAEYKNFDLSALIQGVGKRDGYLGLNTIEPMGIFAALEEHYNESFDPKKPNADAYYPRLLGSGQRYNWQNYSHWVQDASYVRLKNLVLGYNFNLKNSPVKNLRISFSGQNLFVLTKYRVFDPENGINSTSFPNVAVYTLGLNMRF